MAIQGILMGVLVVLACVLTITMLVYVRRVVTHLQDRAWSSAVGDGVLLLWWAMVFVINVSYTRTIVWDGFWLRLLAILVGIVCGVSAMVWRTRRGVAHGR